MKLKRSKQYRKLIEQFALTFGFRPPFQILVDAQMIQDANRFKMDLVRGLERTLGDAVKPMITQCSIRHLYLLKDVSQDQKDALILTAKAMERRRCNHHTLEEPLSTLECFGSVIDPGNSLSNKHRYVVASQDDEVRRYCRGLKGVPLIYVKKSVMIMEPMSEGSMTIRESQERSKFRSGLKTRGTVRDLKRKREDEGEEKHAERIDHYPSHGGRDGNVQKKKARGPKGPNPLSMKKSKSEALKIPKQPPNVGIPDHAHSETLEKGASTASIPPATGTMRGALDKVPQSTTRQKRKRKHKPKQNDAATPANNVHTNIQLDE